MQAFLDFRGFNFCGFQFTAVYNSILFSSSLVMLSNLDLRGFCFPRFFFMCPHINSLYREMPVCNFPYMFDSTLNSKTQIIFYAIDAISKSIMITSGTIYIQHSSARIIMEAVQLRVVIPTLSLRFLKFMQSAF